jgi:hypothetical protein
MRTEFCFENLQGKRLLGRPRRREKNNIKMDLREIGHEGMKFIDGT